MISVYRKLLDIKAERGCGFLVLLDPDRKPSSGFANYVHECERAGVDAFLVGSSILINDQFESALKEIKPATKLPVIIFPASAAMVSRHADAILYLSLISGRNPNLLIEEHVKSAPMIKSIGLETISTAYMLIESGALTAVSYVSNTLPIPRDKPEIACAHALAGQYLGMKLVYLEAGSGAREPVPLEMIERVSGYVDIPVIVGGGIKDPGYAAKVAQAGASFVVVGNALEIKPDLVAELTQAVHNK